MKLQPKTGNKRKLIKWQTITRSSPALSKALAPVPAKLAGRSTSGRARPLVAQLRGIDPPLSEADITRERLALEDAIRKVEAETVRKSRTEPRPAAPPLRPTPIQVPAQPQSAATAAAGAAFTAAASAQSPPPPRRERSGTLRRSSAGAAPRFAAARAAANRAAAAARTRPTSLPDEAAKPAPPSARNRLLNARTSPGAARRAQGLPQRRQ